MRFLVLFNLMLISSPVIAADKPVAKTESDTLEIPDCTVSLIRHVMLATSQPGVIAEVKFKEGESVKKGELVARLRNDVAKSIVNIAHKQVENDMDIRLAKTLNEVATTEYKRIRKLNERSQIVTDEQILQRKMTVDQTAIEIEKAEHEALIRKLQLAEAEARLDEHDVTAPFAGVISRVFKSPGESVELGDFVVELVNAQHLKVEGYLDVREAMFIKQGANATVWLSDSDLDTALNRPTFTGKVKFVDIVVQPVTRKVRVVVEVDNPKGLLRPGLLTTISVEAALPKKLNQAQTGQ